MTKNLPARVGRRLGEPTRFPAPAFVARQPGQRRVDHGARKHEAEWRAYQAAWQQPINEIRCSAEAFHHQRRYALMLNRKQTARLLRVSVNSVLNWEYGVHPVPFAAYLALLLISQSEHYRLSGEAWRDFELRQRFNPDQRASRKKHGYVVELVDRITGAAFTPDDLRRYSQMTGR